MASPSAGAPALNYGDVNTVAPSPGEVKGLIKLNASKTLFYELALSLLNFSHMINYHKSFYVECYNIYSLF